MPLFESWLTLGRAALTTVLLFGLLLAGVRLVGKRVTTHMNNFDWIVTVAVGALLAKTILIEEVTLAEGSVAVMTLLVLQFAATKAATRFSFAERTLLSRPTRCSSTEERSSKRPCDASVSRRRRCARRCVPPATPASAR
jgi:hypothetical protein